METLEIRVESIKESHTHLQDEGVALLSVDGIVTDDCADLVKKGHEVIQDIQESSRMAVRHLDVYLHDLATAFQETDQQLAQVMSQNK